MLKYLLIYINFLYFGVFGYSYINIIEEAIYFNIKSNAIYYNFQYMEPNLTSFESNQSINHQSTQFITHNLGQTEAQNQRSVCLWLQFYDLDSIKSIFRVDTTENTEKSEDILLVLYRNMTTFSIGRTDSLGDLNSIDYKDIKAYEWYFIYASTYNIQSKVNIHAKIFSSLTNAILPDVVNREFLNILPTKNTTLNFWIGGVHYTTCNCQISQMKFFLNWGTAISDFDFYNMKAGWLTLKLWLNFAEIHSKELNPMNITNYSDSYQNQKKFEDNDEPIKFKGLSFIDHVSRHQPKNAFTISFHILFSSNNSFSPISSFSFSESEQVLFQRASTGLISEEKLSIKAIFFNEIFLKEIQIIFNNETKVIPQIAILPYKIPRNTWLLISLYVLVENNRTLFLALQLCEENSNMIKIKEIYTEEPTDILSIGGTIHGKNLFRGSIRYFRIYQGSGHYFSVNQYKFGFGVVNKEIHKLSESMNSMNSIANCLYLCEKLYSKYYDNISLSLEQCISNCNSLNIDNTQYQNKRLLSACPGGCKQCSNNQCDSCLANYFLYRGQCMGDCPEGYYHNTDTSTCDPCNLACLNCTGSSSTECTACSGTGQYTYLQSNTCLSSCYAGYYADTNNICIQCHSSCATCNGPLSTNCLTCNGTYYRTSTSSNTCMTSCPGRTWPDLTNPSNQICSDCDLSCTTCTGSSSTNCLTCTGLYYKNTESNTCTTSCPSNTWPNSLDSSNHLCSNCDPSCNTCNGSLSTNCLTCTRSRYKNIKDNTCVTTCSQQTWYDYSDPLNPLCRACDNTCNTCSGSQSNNCITCNSTLYFIPSTNSCVRSCPTQTWVDQMSSTNPTCSPCSTECLECNGLTEKNCTSCQANKFLYNNQCYSSCPAKSYPNSLITCASCHNECATCNGPLRINCIACETNLFKHPNYTLEGCVSQCPIGYYGNTSTGICDNCNPVCITCIGPTNNQCGICQSNKYNYNRSCVEVCPDGTFGDYSTKYCYPCDSSCQTCSGSGPKKCLSCKSNLALYNSSCVSKCPGNMVLLRYSSEQIICDECDSSHVYSLQNLTCLSCDSSCLTCVNPTSSGCSSCPPISYSYLQAGKCLSCTNPYFSLNNGNCIEICGSGVRYGNTKECDDGNQVNGDGCSKDCKVESEWICKGGNSTTHDVCIQIEAPEAYLNSDQISHLKVTLIFSKPMLFGQQDLENVPTTTNWSKLINLSISNLAYPNDFSYNILPINSTLFIINLNIKISITDNDVLICTFPNQSFFTDIYSNQILASTQPMQLFELFLPTVDDLNNINRLIKAFHFSFIGISVLSLPFLLIGEAYVIWGIVDIMQIMYFLLFVNINLPLNVESIFQTFGIWHLNFLPNLFNIISNSVNMVIPQLNVPIRFKNQDQDELFISQGALHLSWTLITLIIIGFFGILNKITGNSTIHVFINIIASSFKWSLTLGYLLLSYLQLSLSAVLQILNFSQNILEIISIIFASLTGFYLFGFPILVFRLVARNIRMLNLKDFNNKYGTLYNGFKITQKTKGKYLPSLFILRKLAYSIALVLLYSFPVIVLALEITKSILCILMIIIKKPWMLKILNIKNAIQEFIYTTLNIMIIIIYFNAKEDKKFQLGWYIIILSGGILSINAIGILFNLPKALKTLKNNILLLSYDSKLKKRIGIKSRKLYQLSNHQYIFYNKKFMLENDILPK